MAAPSKGVQGVPAKAAAPPSKPRKNLAIHLVAGGVGGFCEAITCHPLDTIKVRLQLRERNGAGYFAGNGRNGRSCPWGGGGNVSSGPCAATATERSPSRLQPRATFISVGVNIARKEGVLALYKGLGAVISGIVPKMAIRFSSFELYQSWLADPVTRKPSTTGVFLAGLGAGVTESILVVTPMDVIKIRLQAQRHSMTDPLDIPKYRNAAHCAYVLVKEEGIQALYKGVALTALRQSTNQAANFTVYQYLKTKLHEMQPGSDTLPAYQHMLAGFVSGACGPLFNAPIDTIKTRIQRSPSRERGWTRFQQVSVGIVRNEGWRALYKGLLPRVLRVAPGQAITFMVYERVYNWLLNMSQSLRIDSAVEAALQAEQD